MQEHHTTLSELWDKSFLEKGHTGYTDPLKLQYDQPIRITSISRILDRLYPNGDLSGKQALDIGCGTGDFIALLRQKGASVTAFDISPKVIEGTSQRFQDDNKVSLHCGPVVDIPLKRGIFDVVTSVTVLQHILQEDELIDSLQLIKDSMKADGSLIVLELAPPHSESIKHYNNNIPYLLERPVDVWKSAFSKAGFVLIQEPIMPQLGITMLRGFGSLVELVSKSGKNIVQNTPSQESSNKQESKNIHPTFMQKLKQMSFLRIRKLILLLARPFDHTFKLPFPGQSRRYYHIFVYKLKQQ